MVGYAERRTWGVPTEDQRKFLEALRDVGPRDNAQTAGIRKATKRACRVRGWVEWRRTDGVPERRAWHLTIAGQKALSLLRRRSGVRDEARLTSPLGPFVRRRLNTTAAA